MNKIGWRKKIEGPNLPESTPPARPMSMLALVSLISGLLGLLFIPFVGGIVAVVTGNMSRRETRVYPPTRSGDGMATAGIILGWLGIVAWIIVCCLAGFAGLIYWVTQAAR